jgi:pre-mRNA-splicing factor ATP-dependent RNA helicase DHX15/PRP43
LIGGALSERYSYATDLHNKNWAWDNYLSARALSQAENVRTQLLRIMERHDLDIVSISDERKLYDAIKQSLVCGFFMQVAFKEGEKGTYVTVKDNQVRDGSKCLGSPPNQVKQIVALHPSCGLDTQPDWVLFNEFAFTSRYYIRTVTTIKPQW